MPATFVVPDLGEGLEEVTIVRWNVRPGDRVELNDVVCVVETAKAEVEVPIPFAGVVRELGGAEGETLRVGVPLVLVDRADVAEPTVGSPAEPTVGSMTEPAPARAEHTRTTLVGYGVRDESPPTRPRSARVRQRPRAKPPVRKLARSLGIDLDAVAGSGPDGIITRSDVERHSAARQPAPPAVGALAGTSLPVVGVRARIADRLTASRRQIPDATCSVVADCAELLGAAERVSAMHGEVVSPFALLCRFVVAALVRHPDLNATYRAEVPEIVRHGAVHLGVATATERGLVVPVLRDAHARDGRSFLAEMQRIVCAARDGSLAPAELVGSTFTVSNFGALGIDEGVPIINHPEAAILGVGSIAQRPHVVEGEVVARPTMHLTLAFDHRVCDGAEAAALLRTIRDLVEHPVAALAVL